MSSAARVRTAALHSFYLGVALGNHPEMAESESWYPSIAALARSGRKRNEGFEREKTIVGGRVVVRGGRMTTVDEAAFRARRARAARRHAAIDGGRRRARPLPQRSRPALKRLSPADQVREPPRQAGRALGGRPPEAAGRGLDDPQRRQRLSLLQGRRDAVHHRHGDAMPDPGRQAGEGCSGQDDDFGPAIDDGTMGERNEALFLFALHVAEIREGLVEAVNAGEAVNRR